jgi:hypothetical protein
MTAYQQRLAPETKVKICRLDVLPSEKEVHASDRIEAEGGQAEG